MTTRAPAVLIIQKNNSKADKILRYGLYVSQEGGSISSGRNSYLSNILGPKLHFWPKLDSWNLRFLTFFHWKVQICNKSSIFVSCHEWQCFFWGHLDSRMNFGLDRDRVGIWLSGGFKDLENQEVHCFVCSSDNLAWGWQYIEIFIAGLSWWQKKILPCLEDYATDWQECQTSGQPSPTSPFRGYFLPFQIIHAILKWNYVGHYLFKSSML